jgi:hypothetical protein
MPVHMLLVLLPGCKKEQRVCSWENKREGSSFRENRTLSIFAMVAKTEKCIKLRLF